MKFVEGDITDEVSLKGVPPVEVIFHCAALVEDRDLEKLLKVNLAGTENVCRLALRLGVKRLVYLSSVAVACGNHRLPLTEDLPYCPTNLYGVSKVEAEQRVLEFRAQGLPAAIIRPGPVYGEGEPHLSGRLFFLLKRRLLALPERGKRKMHMVYVKNLCGLLLSAMEDPRFLDGTFFSADEDALSYAEVFGILARSAGVPAPAGIPDCFTALISSLPVIGPKYKSLCQDRVYDISRIRALGYHDRVPAREALERMGRAFIRR